MVDNLRRIPISTTVRGSKGIVVCRACGAYAYRTGVISGVLRAGAFVRKGNLTGKKQAA